MKYKYINAEELEILIKSPDWYIKIKPELDKNCFFTFSSQEVAKEKEEYIHFLSNALKKGRLNLGKEKLNLDKERKPIDTIVIHHTSRRPEVHLEIIDAMCMIRLYINEFTNKERFYFGKPLTSDHEFEGRTTFLPYHYIVLNDGSYINPLKDKEIGWHAGNWDYNCRSIAIAFHDELQNKKPTKKAIETARNIIKKYKPKEVLGHREISSESISPGDMFLGQYGWKDKLI